MPQSLRACGLSSRYAVRKSARGSSSISPGGATRSDRSIVLKGSQQERQGVPGRTGTMLNFACEKHKPWSPWGAPPPYPRCVITPNNRALTLSGPALDLRHATEQVAQHPRRRTLAAAKDRSLVTPAPNTHPKRPPGVSRRPLDARQLSNRINSHVTTPSGGPEAPPAHAE